MALVGIKLFESQNRGQKQVESNYEIVNIVQSQRQLLSSVNNCTESFRGISPSAGTASTLKQFRSTPAPGFQDKFTVGQPIMGQIKVTNYELVKLNIPASELETFVRYRRGAVP